MKKLFIVLSLLVVGVCCFAEMKMKSMTEKEDDAKYTFEYLTATGNYYRLIQQTEKFYLDTWRSFGYEFGETIETFENIQSRREALDILARELGIPKKHRDIVVEDRLLNAGADAFKHGDKFGWLIYGKKFYNHGYVEIDFKNITVKVTTIYEKSENEKLYKEHPLKNKEYNELLKIKD